LDSPPWGGEDEAVSRRGWILFAAMCVIWGIPYLLIKVAVEELAPATLVLARTGVAALVLVPIALAQGQFRGLGAVWKPLVLYTLAEMCGPFLLLGYAETRLSSSLTGLLIAAVPIVVALLSRLTGGQERLGARRLSGLLLGIVGVAALVGFDLRADNLLAVCAIGGVVLGYAIGPLVLARRLSDQPGLGVVAASLLLAALAYLPLGVAQAPRQWPSGRVLAAVLTLSLVCTALAFLVFFQLIAEVGSGRATVITYINPAVAVLLGVLVLDERFTLAIGAGFVLVLAGSVLATSRSSSSAADGPDAPLPSGPASGLVSGSASGPEAGPGAGVTGVPCSALAATPVAEP
jgi:drug/metabolite transporter (DMT)-like permease